MIFTINTCNADPKDIDIQAGDWVDVSQSLGVVDPAWGLSVEIHEIDGSDQIWAKFWSASLNDYELSVVDPYWIVDNFRKIPFEV